MDKCGSNTQKLFSPVDQTTSSFTICLAKNIIRLSRKPKKRMESMKKNGIRWKIKEKEKTGSKMLMKCSN